MKLVTFDADGKPRLGVMTADENHVVDIQAAEVELNGQPGQAFRSMLALIENGDEALDKLRETFARADQGQVPKAFLPMADVPLLAPIPAPPQMRDCMCFEKHLQQAMDQAILRQAANSDDPAGTAEELRASGRFNIPQIWYDQPIYYKANRFAVTGTGTDVVWPSYSHFMDYEMEFGIFIGKGGKDIPADRAAEHIFGYTVFNDFSARDAQMAEMAAQLGPAKGKDFDNANVMGPCIVTADEFGDPYNHDMIVRVNGTEMSRGSSSEMHWKFEEVIAHISQGETLHPGEFIGSGTVGDGCGLEHGRALSAGDVVELEVSGIGVIRNRVLRND
jgi:2-keto-4-pentenoate hydratase/2-oxohepta-3-ene-1,7-dioic acid hydratase in catechol pathway